MALDPVVITAGANSTPPDQTKVATDDTGAQGRVQLFKLAYSALGISTLVNADINGLLVNLAPTTTGGMFPPTATISNDTVNPVTTKIQSFPMMWDADDGLWDRLRGRTEYGLATYPTAITISDLSETKVDVSTATDTVLIPGTISETGRLYMIHLVAAGTQTITFKDASTALTGAISMVVGVPYILSFCGRPYYTTTAAQALNLTTSAAVQVSGRAYWKKTPAGEP